MTLLHYITANHPNFNVEIVTEEDLKIKVVMPYLQELGYGSSEIRFGNSIPVQIGTKQTVVFSDVEILIDGRVQIVIDTKTPHKTINEKDELQALSYAKLVSTPPALYSAVTNGPDCPVTNVFSGQSLAEIPTRAQLLREINRSGQRRLTDVELREVRSVLITLRNTEDLYKIIRKCKEIIESRGRIRADASFREMTKILLVKMNEERRVRSGQGQNRFSLEYIAAWARANQLEEIDAFKDLFTEAKASYPAIYGVQDDALHIQDNECIKQVVEMLEPWSFLGTGDDIKGAVYEIFLKASLRGELDQYFTPREIVDFIVGFCDPQIGQRVIDPACGSGGFLIQYFNYVRSQINKAPLSEADRQGKFQNLIDVCLWGNEADYDLHILAKINLVMHGDGYNHITSGDSLQKFDLPASTFDYVLTNPPFTLRYTFGDVLSKYEQGVGKEWEELDILFVERCLQLARPGGEIFIVLPEGLLNLSSHREFREWICSKAHIVASISLPEGAFIPFGKSVSKTCILGLRKKYAEEPSTSRPEFVFLGRAKKIGYEAGKRDYKPIAENDLEEFARRSRTIFEDVVETETGGECGWLKQDEVTPDRLDASFLLNRTDRASLHQKHIRLEPLSRVCTINNVKVTPPEQESFYELAVPSISAFTGIVSTVPMKTGGEIGSGKYEFKGGDVLFTRINPRINRVTIAPDYVDRGFVSPEVFNMVLLPDSPIRTSQVLCAVLQTSIVQRQLERLGTGSSSSRSRVQEEDMLEEVFVPIPDDDVQETITRLFSAAMPEYWKASRAWLTSYATVKGLLGDDVHELLFPQV